MTYPVNTPYAIAQFPTPVFNTPHLSHCFGGEDGNSLPLDNQGLMRTVETVLFPDSRIDLIENIADSSIWKIRTEEYPYQGNLYIDARFVQFSTPMPPSRNYFLPHLEEIRSKLKALIGTRYLWGGNWPEGIDLLPKWYPSRDPLDQLSLSIQNIWKLKGVDCSGLLYYVSNGSTPRNTSTLTQFGQGVCIEGLNTREIVKKLKDLDLIVWKGHVVCVLNENTAIESHALKGVIESDVSSRLTDIMKERNPVNAWEDSKGPQFVVRRWHPDRL